MKLIIKDKKNQYNIEVKSLFIKVSDLKLEMQKQFGLDIKKIKLIYNGKYLSDNQTLASYKIKEDSKLIFQGIINENNNNIVNKEENNSSIFENSKEIDQKYLSQLHNLIKLGFEKEKAENIIKQFNGDINKIIEYLSNSKEDKKDNNNNNGNNNNNNNNNNKIINDINEENTKKESKKEITLPKELKNYGIYMKILTLKDENKMTIILNNIKKTNPALLNQMKKYEKEFIKFLSLPITQEELLIYKNNYKNAQALLGEKKDKTEIYLTEIESEIINNLIKLGNCNIEDAIEAYIINDKDENRAADYLLYKNILYK